MRLRNLLIILVFIPISICGQVSKTDTNVISLVNKLQPWDYGYQGCWGSNITDSVMWTLIERGKPIAKAILAYLDSTEKTISIHIILSSIYGDTINSKEKTISKSENKLVKQREINGLIFTKTLLIEPYKVDCVIDQRTQQRIRELWRKRIL